MLTLSLLRGCHATSLPELFALRNVVFGNDILFEFQPQTLNIIECQSVVPVNVKQMS